MNQRLLAAALLLAACRTQEPGAQASATPATNEPTGGSHVRIEPKLLDTGRVRVEAVGTRALSSELRVAGEVRPSEAGSAEAGTLVAGRVASFEVAEGTRVKRGQILAWVDAPEVARAAADLLLARAHAAVAARKRARQEALDATSATSQNALDDARADDEAARAQLLAARTLLTSLGGAEPPADPNATTLIVRVPVRAPIAGIVAERRAPLGGAVAPDTALFRIVGDSQQAWLVSARVPETSSLRPGPGTAATLSPRGDSSTTCAARVEGSPTGVDPSTRTLSIRLAPEPTCGWLMPGSFVDVLFAGNGAPSTQPGSLVIARSAVVDVHGKPTVFVAGSAPGEFDARPVQLGAGDATHVSVENGLAVGEKLVVEGTFLLKGEMLRGELEGH